MKNKWLRNLAVLFFVGALVTIGATAVFGYVWYTYPDVINNLFFTPTPGVIKNPGSGISVAGKSTSVLTATNSLSGSPAGTPLAMTTAEFTSTPTPTITGTVEETPTGTTTVTATSTATSTPTKTYSANTALPYTPASTYASYPTATKTRAPYYPPPTKTFTPTTKVVIPTATKTPTPTERNVQAPPPTYTHTPTYTSTPQEDTGPPPTHTYTPTPTNTRTPTAIPSGPSPTPTIDISGCSYSNHGSYENQLLGLINDLRASHGLARLNMQYQLVGAAKEHSNDMACNNFVSHTGSNGTSNSDRILAYGYSYSWRGENIYMGWNATPQDAFNWWINSEPHLNNLLGSAYIHIGIGHTVVGSRNAYTLVFARP
jgi:uncharacterized protein YkwD